MTDIRTIEFQPLDAAGAAAGLRDAGDGARGFLGLDPVTQNDVLLGRELAGLQAQVFRAGDTLLGCVINEEQPCQAFVATSSADPAPLRAFLGYLNTYMRCTTYAAMVPAGSVVEAAFRGCDFNQVGALRDHRYQSAGYQDVLVYFAQVEDVCRS